MRESDIILSYFKKRDHVKVNRRLRGMTLYEKKDAISKLRCMDIGEKRQLRYTGSLDFLDESSSSDSSSS